MTEITLNVQGLNVEDFDTLILKIPIGKISQFQSENFMDHIKKEFPDKTIIAIPDVVDIEAYKKKIDNNYKDLQDFKQSKGLSIVDNAIYKVTCSKCGDIPIGTPHICHPHIPTGTFICSKCIDDFGNEKIKERLVQQLACSNDKRDHCKGCHIRYCEAE